MAIDGFENNADLLLKMDCISKDTIKSISNLQDLQCCALQYMFKTVILKNMNKEIKLEKNCSSIMALLYK